MNLSEMLNPALLAQKLAAQQAQDKLARESIFGADASNVVPEGVKELTPSQTVEIVRQSGDPVAAKAAESALGVSNELRGLFIQYCASMIQAIELKDVDWGPLALRLGTRKEHLQQAAEFTDASSSLWREVMIERIKRVGAARTFRDVKWETIESKSLNMLTELLEKNLIRDPGELMALAAQARKVNVHESGGHNPNQNNFTINIGGDPLGQDSLPASGAKMTIDLSPRMATSLANRPAELDKTDRVIDSSMLEAKELRTILEERNSRIVEHEGVTNEQS